VQSTGAVAGAAPAATDQFQVRDAPHPAGHAGATGFARCAQKRKGVRSDPGALLLLLLPTIGGRQPNLIAQIPVGKLGAPRHIIADVEACRQVA